jgi:hypothetical protein
MIDDEEYEAYLSLRRQLSQETDRGAVIIAAALLDNALKSMLQSRLCPSIERDDELFEGAYAPFNNFAAKIDLAFRVGLIRAEVRKSFHLVRKLRNDFAHRAHEIDFSDMHVQDRLRELFRINENILSAIWQDIQGTHPDIFKEAKGLNADSSVDNWLSLIGPRGVFDFLFASISAFLTRLSAQIEPLHALYDRN